MAEIRTTHLMTLTLSVAGMQPIGATPNGNRRIGLVSGGRFEGAKLKGKVLPGGADWIIGRPDGSTTLDVRIVLETDDGAAIGMTYRGMRHGPEAVIEKLNAGQFVEPSQYYFRTAVAFETAAPRYDWLNRIIAVGTGSRPPEGPIYDIFEVLDMATIGFIGLGNMGAPMAANLVKAGHAVTGYDLVPAALQALAAAGGKIAASATEAAKGADVVITMLPEGAQVREVWLHQGGLIEAVKDAKPLLIDCSTIDVESARTVTAAAEAAGLEMLDAPVSGGTIGAQNATLTFMVGGAEKSFARGKPVLEAMGKNIFHAGGPGAGQSVKICNNMMAAINVVGVSEGFLLAQKLGLDWSKVHEICSTATSSSWALNTYCPAPGPAPAAPSNRDYAPGFMTRLMVKDVRLSQAAADATGVPTPLAALALTMYEAAMAAGYGSKDFSVVFRWLAEQQRQT